VHLIVSWEIDAQKERWTEINEALRRQLDAFSWAKPLSAFYVVRVSSAEDRDGIFGDLQRVVGSTPEQVRVIVSPVISKGLYEGCLPQDHWLHVNEIAET
jgi:hypothetical protein